MLSAGVVFATAAGFNRFATGAFVGAALAGGVALQLPLGSWSDRVDRRIVIATTAVVAAVVAVLAAQVETDRRLVLIALTAVAGGSAFPLYSLSVAHLNDYLDEGRTVAAGARMVLINGVGAIAGPILGSMAIGLVSPSSLFLVLAAAYLVVGGYALFRMSRRSAAEEAERATFSPVTVGVGPTTAMVSESEVPERFPLERGHAPVGEGVADYREQGAGPPVVLIGDVVGSGTDEWEELLVPLAADGIRAIAPRFGGRNDPVGEEVVDAVLAVLRHLELPSATFVGVATGVEVARRLREDHADRTDAVVLLVDRNEARPLGHDEASHPPVLVLDRRQLVDEPSDVADEIAQLCRHLVTGQSGQAAGGGGDALGD